MTARRSAAKDGASADRHPAHTYIGTRMSSRDVSCASFRRCRVRLRRVETHQLVVVPVLDDPHLLSPAVHLGSHRYLGDGGTGHFALGQDTMLNIEVRVLRTAECPDRAPGRRMVAFNRHHPEVSRSRPEPDGGQFRFRGPAESPASPIRRLLGGARLAVIGGNTEAFRERHPAHANLGTRITSRKFSSAPFRRCRVRLRRVPPP